MRSQTSARGDTLCVVPQNLYEFWAVSHATDYGEWSRKIRVADTLQEVNKNQDVVHSP